MYRMWQWGAPSTTTASMRISISRKDAEFSNLRIARSISCSHPLRKPQEETAGCWRREDLIFFKPHYAYALAQYCKANHISAEEIQSGKIPDAARAYAIREAQKATYRDTNQFSQIISNLGRTDRSTEAGKAVGMVVDGIFAVP